MSLGRGFRRALLAVLGARGAPWIMRGSFMRLASSFAGAVQVSKHSAISQRNIPRVTTRL